VNRTEMAQLLALVSTLDNREVVPTTVEAWMGVLGDLQLRDCEAAVRQHFQTSAEYLMPVHVRSIAERVAFERADRQRQELDRQLTPKPLAGALFGTEREPGKAIMAHVFAALRAAGQNVPAGVRLGHDRAGQVAQRAAQAWLKAHRTGETPTRRGYPCGRTMCRCTHGVDPDTGAVCEGGWIEDDRPDDQRDPASKHTVLRCPVCAGDRAKILAESPDLHTAGRSLRSSKAR
jgi:hypothetical protein